MKTKSKCIGCEAIKLVNAMGLCKRCNREAHKYITGAEMTRLKMEREQQLTALAAKKALDAEAEAEAAKPEEGDEGEKPEGEGGEGEDEGEGEGKDKPKGEGKDKAKSDSKKSD
jgi:hypothetical protein